MWTSTVDSVSPIDISPIATSGTRACFTIQSDRDSLLALPFNGDPDGDHPEAVREFVPVLLQPRHFLSTLGQVWRLDHGMLIAQVFAILSSCPISEPLTKLQAWPLLPILPVLPICARTLQSRPGGRSSRRA